jgi:protein-S-isoprenylcysteine O-methyltransferase Ste14
VTPLGWLAALVLFVQLPIPLFWFVVHPLVNFWRQRHTAAYITGVLFAWAPVTTCLIVFRHEIFRPDWPPIWSIAVGTALLVLEGWIFWRVEGDLGAARLVGKTELSGGGEVVRHGIYRRMRHPRYVGSFLAILGACLLAGTRVMWMMAAGWMLLTLVAIAFEERELRVRFGAAYEEYCRGVPRFLPLGPKAHARR